MGRVPLDDVAAVIVHAHSTTRSTNLIVALAPRGAVMLVCGSNYAPVAACHPLDGHHAHNTGCVRNGKRASRCQFHEPPI